MQQQPTFLNALIKCNQHAVAFVQYVNFKHIIHYHQIDVDVALLTPTISTATTEGRYCLVVITADIQQVYMQVRKYNTIQKTAYRNVNLIDFSPADSCECNPA